MPSEDIFDSIHPLEKLIHHNLQFNNQNKQRKKNNKRVGAEFSVYPLGFGAVARYIGFSIPGHPRVRSLK